MSDQQCRAWSDQGRQPPYEIGLAFTATSCQVVERVPFDCRLGWYLRWWIVGRKYFTFHNRLAHNWHLGHCPSPYAQRAFRFACFCFGRCAVWLIRSLRLARLLIFSANPRALELLQL